jgi:uncharacterized alpha-E superfamily protein
VLYCLEEITHCIKRLPNAIELYPFLEQLEQQVLAIDIQQTTPEQLHQVLDGLQTRFDGLHGQIAAMWFLKNVDA